MKQDIAEIAGRLTKAQQLAVMYGSFHRSQIGALWRSKLIHLVRRSGYTELGLAVRAHLLADSHPEKQA